MDMGLLSFVMGYVAPVFLIVSPLTSYADQIYSIYRTKSSAGFSLDIPLIMLVASLLKVFYWFGARFDSALLIQACIMIGVQLVMLKVALEHRAPPNPKVTVESMPFVGAREGELGVQRPWNFWQWGSQKPYWEFLTWFTATLVFLQIFIGIMPQYQAFIGYLGLAIEATLPIPQMLANHRAKSCKGFRVSVLGNWLFGDVMKMGFFFFSDGQSVPWAFKLNKWAACSGSIETSDNEPLAAARREIEEETTLTSADIKLLRAGKSYSIVDEELNTEWTIFPFAFLLLEGGKGKDGIVIDWEHTTFDFVRPEEVDERDTVPHLSISLGRVLVGRVVAEGLQELRNDHVNGASVLASKAVEVLTKAVREGDVLAIRSTKEREAENKEALAAWWRGLKMIGWHLKGVRESMGAAITVALCGAFKAVRQEVDIGGSPGDVKRRALMRLEGALLNRRHNTVRIATHFESWLNKHFPGEGPIAILTLSSSSTIRASLNAAMSSGTGRNLRLKVLESRPMFEGVAFVRSLLIDLEKRGMGDRLAVEIASDASVGVIGKDTDIVLLGADRISEDGDVSNKTGSPAAVLCAKEVSPKVKVVVVSELDKVAAPGKMENHKEEDNEISELTVHWPSPRECEAQPTSEQWMAAVKVRNVYFEWVPARHIDAYVSESGDLNLEDIKHWSRHVSQLEEEMFGDL